MVNIKLHKYLPIFVIIVFLIIFFRKIFFGLIPIPFDLLVSWFFPYNNGGWQVEGIWTQAKGGQFASDAIRQIYPWRELAIETIKSGQLPLWNPYNFSGSPLLANMQSAIFYPLNILFFIIPSFPWAWAMYISLTLLLSSVFMYIFLSSLKIKKPAALFGALAFASSGNMISWLEWGVVPHAMVWLPLSLYSINLWFKKRNYRFLILFIISIVFTIFAGYPQGSAYNIIIVASYFIFLLLKTNKNRRMYFTLPLVISGLLAIGITAVQWLPTSELFFQSAMKGEVSQTLSREAAMPLPHFATLLAPDYFGNRVTENYWAKTFSRLDYMDADLFIGISTILMATLAIIAKKKNKEINWLILVIIFGILLGSKNPISGMIADIGIPVIGTGAAAEALVMLIFAFCCLGAFGLNSVVEQKKKREVRITLIIIIIPLIILGVSTFFLKPEYALIARRNSIIPLVTFFASAIVLLILTDKKKRYLISYFFILILALELLLHSNKILPFSSTKFAFPNHLLIEELRSRSGFNRVAGFWETEITTNFHTAFRLYSVEGYDPLYLRRYGEFISSANLGKLTKVIPRSDADITMENEENRNRLLDLTSIKFIPAKVTNPSENWEEEPLKYNPERFRLVWQKEGFKIYRNLHSLPRVKLFYNWLILEKDENIIKTLFSQTFDPHEQVILESDPLIEKNTRGIGEARITDYQATKVEIETNSNQPAILLLTDSISSGWSAFIDGNPTEIKRANYTYRALVLPEGKHQVIFLYKPTIFSVGVIISTILLLIGIILAIYIIKKQYF